MVYEVKLWWVVFLVLIVSEKIGGADGKPAVPCFFVFGDSLADNGNNNKLQTLAKANYPPYGIDYPDGQSGRFTNGMTTVDILARALGFDHHIPPFATAKGKIILKGVNYASGSAGIRDETGKHLGQNISLKKQIKNHQTTISRMKRKLGNNNRRTMKRLKRCLYTVGMGSNDYINNYFMPQYYNTSKYFSFHSYAKALIRDYSKQLTKLYDKGARRFALFGLGSIGCIPHSIATFGPSSGSICVNKMNKAVRLFNEKIVSLVQQFNNDLSDSKFIYVNASSMEEGDPIRAGFKVLRSGCCEVREDGQCIKNQPPCTDRRAFIFWDSFHPSEATNFITAARTYKSFVPPDNYPFDLNTLVKFDFGSNKSPK